MQQPHPDHDPAGVAQVWLGPRQELAHRQVGGKEAPHDQIGLGLAGPAAGDFDARPGHEAPDAAHPKLAQEVEEDEVGSKEALQGGDDDDEGLEAHVAELIQDLAEPRDLPTAAREVAVEIVGDTRQYGQGNAHGMGKVEVHHHAQAEDHDAEQCDHVGEGANIPSYRRSHTAFDSTKGRRLAQSLRFPVLLGACGPTVWLYP